MISINNVNVSFGGFTLLNDINFHITDNDRIGLVGKNGAGKSTLAAEFLKKGWKISFVLCLKLTFRLKAQQLKNVIL